MEEKRKPESNKKDRDSSTNWNTADPLSYHLLKEDRAYLMDHMTEAESFLWTHLKGKKLGVKFRRQHIIDGFIPDFVSLSCKLIVEIDGKIHDLQKEQDENRTLMLNQRGFRVIRFTNEEVLHNLDYVLKTIRGNLTTPPGLPEGEEKEGIEKLLNTK